MNSNENRLDSTRVDGTGREWRRGGGVHHLNSEKKESLEKSENTTYRNVVIFDRFALETRYSMVIDTVTR